VLRFLTESVEERLFPACQDLSGEVIAKGNAVSRVDVGDTVSGVISLTSRNTACSDYCVLSELDIGELAIHSVIPGMENV